MSPRMSSDSVNLGSNPSPPANQNIDGLAFSRPGHSGHLGQTAHSGRTRVGTAILTFIAVGLASVGWPVTSALWMPTHTIIINCTKVPEHQMCVAYAKHLDAAGERNRAWQP